MSKPQEYRLHTLGRVDLVRPDGSTVDAVLSRPKRLALLVYLAAQPHPFTRRDSVLAVFWPEFDQERARAALRKAVHLLRAELGERVIVARGYEEIGVDQELLACDVRDFESMLDRGDREGAIALYSNDFLDGLHVSDAPGFERWVESKRTALRQKAVSAAETLTVEALAANSIQRVIRWADRWTRLAPNDEAAARALMTAYQRNGRPGKAVATYHELDATLAELELQPSPETRDVFDRLHERPDRPSETPDPSGSVVDEISPRSQPRPTAEKPVGDEATPLKVGFGLGPRRRAWLLVSLVLVLGAGAFTVATGRRADETADPSRPPRVAVLPFVNRTGDEDLDHIREAITHELTAGLAQVRIWHEEEFRMGVVQVVPGADSAGLAAGAPATNDADTFTNGARADYTVTGSYTLRDDSLRIQAAITDTRAGRNVPPPRLAAGRAVMPDVVVAALTNNVQGAVAYAASAGPWLDTMREAPPYDAYEAWAEGIQALARLQFAESEMSHRRAIALAPDFTRAYWTLGNGALYNLQKWAAMDSLVAQMSATGRPMSVAHRAVRDAFRAMARGNVRGAFAAADQLAEAVPYGPSWFLKGMWAVAANYPRAGVDAQMMVVDSAPDFADLWPYTWDLLTNGLHLLGDHESEFDLARKADGIVPKQWAVQMLAVAAAARGQIGDVERFVEEGFNVGRTFLFVDAASELRRHGHRAAGDSLLVRYISLLGDTDRPVSPGLMADALLMLGRVEEARTILDAVDSTKRSTSLLGRLGVVAALEGDSAKSRQISELLAAAGPQSSFGIVALWRAKIAAALGNEGRAVEDLRMAFTEGHTVIPQFMRFTFHRDPAFESLWDYQPYIEFLRPKG